MIVLLAREATKLVPNSRYVTAQNASGEKSNYNNR
jgi:hypothetical protein